jgi:flagellar motor switch protein FliG
MAQIDTPASPTGLDNLTGMQRSAIMMLMLGEEQAAVVLGNMSPLEVRNICSAMYSVQNTDQETVAGVLDEFLVTLGQQTNIGLDSGTYTPLTSKPERSDVR